MCVRFNVTQGEHCFSKIDDLKFNHSIIPCDPHSSHIVKEVSKLPKIVHLTDVLLSIFKHDFFFKVAIALCCVFLE